MHIIDPIPDGSTSEQAIVINEKSEIAGVAAEYAWLQEHYPGYKLSIQFLSKRDNKSYDIMLIDTAEGNSKKIYFDISAFHG